jgi:hypothetical protein
MADSAPVIMRTRQPGWIRLPEVIDILEFTLVIEGQNTPIADELAAQIRRRFSDEFAKCDPLLATVYELVIEETEVWEGSRRSHNRGKLKRRQGGSWIDKLKRTGGAVVIVLTILSTDYKKIPENLGWVGQKVEQTFHGLGHQIEIRDMHIFPPNFRPPSP